MSRSSCCSFLVAILVSLGNLTMAPCQEAASKASVEELTSLIQSIDPYRPSSEVSGTVRLYGSTSMDAMAHGWGEGFTQFHKNAKIEVSAAGSGEAFARLLADPSSIAMLSHPVTAEELTELKSKGLKDPVAFEVAKEALGVFVHDSNPVQSISGEQLRAVFTVQPGTAAPTWQIFGTSGSMATQPIHIISRTENSGTQQFLKKFVFESAELRPGLSSHQSNAQVVAAIDEDPLAIGLCGLRCSSKSARPLHLVAGAAVIPSDDHAVLTGQYPLTRPLTLVVDLGANDEQSKLNREFLRFVMCRSGQSEAIFSGFFPIDLPRLRASMQRLDAGVPH